MNNVFVAVIDFGKPGSDGNEEARKFLGQISQFFKSEEHFKKTEEKPTKKMPHPNTDDMVLQSGVVLVKADGEYYIQESLGKHDLTSFGQKYLEELNDFRDIKEGIPLGTLKGNAVVAADPYNEELTCEIRGRFPGVNIIFVYASSADIRAAREQVYGKEQPAEEKPVAPEHTVDPELLKKWPRIMAEKLETIPVEANGEDIYCIFRKGRSCAKVTSLRIHAEYAFGIGYNMLDKENGELSEEDFDKLLDELYVNIPQTPDQLSEPAPMVQGGLDYLAEQQKPTAKKKKSGKTEPQSEEKQQSYVRFLWTLEGQWRETSVCLNALYQLIGQPVCSGSRSATFHNMEEYREATLSQVEFEVDDKIAKAVSNLLKSFPEGKDLKDFIPSVDARVLGRYKAGSMKPNKENVVAIFLDILFSEVFLYVRMHSEVWS